MTSQTHTTALVLIPPQRIWPPIQAIRQEHDRAFRRWMPHITLLYPFRPFTQFAELVLPLVEACHKVEPFEVTLAELGHLSHSNDHTLWLAPEPKPALIDLQTALWQAVPDCDDTRRFANGFTPHLSVGQWRGDAQKALHTLQTGWTPLHFQAAEISLIWRDDPPDDIFRIWRSIRLGKIAFAHPGLTVEAMTPQDWPAVRRIYQQGIDTGNATLTTLAPTWPQWDAAHLRECRRVARRGDEIIGWAALSAVSSRAVYAGVAEVSIYVGAAAQGQGVGKALFEALIAASEQCGIWTLQSSILAENEASIALHEKCGFRKVGTRERLGHQRGVWRDSVLMERRSSVAGEQDKSV